MSGAALGLGASAAALVLGSAAPHLGPLVAGRTGRWAATATGPQRSRPLDPRRMRTLVTAPVGRPQPGTLVLLASATVALAALLPPAAPIPVVLLVVRAHQRDRRARRAAAAAVADGLPDVVDLLLLCAGAGLSVPLAHSLVADRVPGPLGAALQAAEASTAGGRVRADALLEALTPLGDRAAALGHVLVDHLRYGVPLVPGLDRLGLELRLDRRRRAEEEARRIPLRLLAPLIACVLPAFGLLTVVPLLVASLRSLPR